jgi:pyrroline-5-carboxylate reductase
MIERRIGFVGAGVMAEALARGLVGSGTASAAQLHASDPSAARRDVFRDIGAGGVFEDNAELVRACDVVVLAVKPYIVPRAAAGIASAVSEKHLIVSIAAGVTLAALEEALGTARLVRVMPNTPALVGAGASAYCVGADATEEDTGLVDELLSSVGTCCCVAEGWMDAVTGLSGSGPAYVYMVIEALSDGGVRMGLPRDTATELAAQTVLGAAKMVLETGEHPALLRDRVTTPGGTTVEGIHVLEGAGVRRAFMDAVEAATAKAGGRLSGC